MLGAIVLSKMLKPSLGNLIFLPYKRSSLKRYSTQIFCALNRSVLFTAGLYMAISNTSREIYPGRTLFVEVGTDGIRAKRPYSEITPNPDYSIPRMTLNLNIINNPYL